MISFELENLKKNKNIKLALIATYPKMAEIFMRVAKEEGVEAYNVYESFESAANVAKQMESKVDAILSRGGTAHYIQKAVNIPVIFIPITPFDVAQIVHNLDRSVREVAIIHYKENIPEITLIEKMYGIKIHQYTFLNRSDIKQAVHDAFRKGVRTVIGGEVGVEYAREIGMDGIQIGAGEASVRRAVDETIKVLYEKQQERQNTIRVRAIFDSISEGVIATDENKNIMIFNDSADKIFNAHYREGEKIAGNIVDEHFERAFSEQTDSRNIIRKLKDRLVMSNHSPVFLDKEFIGMVSTFSDVTEIQKAESKIRQELHTKGFVAKHTLDDIVTQNSEMLAVKDLAGKYAKTNSAVLIEGESGTGKELFAQGIHNASNRAKGPFVAINCAAIAENLLESELFGYETGAFTGADKKGKVGLFELAHNGTLFLDEIGEISLQLQTSLLRVLQEKEVRRVGGSKIIPVDVRIICATNKNLRKSIEEGTFRNDLYYRLNVLNVKIPPLRSRKDDLEILCKNLVPQIDDAVTDKEIERIIPILKEYSWPGNIRELQNVMERLCALRMYLLDSDETEEKEIKRMLGINVDPEHVDMFVGVSLEGDLKEMLHRVERQIVDYYMEAYGNDQDMVAQRLGIGKTTLWRKRSSSE